jgi:hypothetical protein
MALHAVNKQVYVEGESTRSLDILVVPLVGTGISPYEIRRSCTEDAAWRTRPLNRRPHSLSV